VSPSPELRIQVLKHAPGKRCVVQYQRQDEGTGTLQVVIGKLYRKQRGAAIFERMQQLWQAARRQSLFGMAEPLAYVPELEMVLQNVAPGTQLVSLAAEELAAAVKSTAENLAALHEFDLPLETSRTFDEHLKKYCHPGAHIIGEAAPALREEVETLLLNLQNAMCKLEAPIVPTHGDLGLAQIFLHERRAYFIDFDGFGFAHAELDVGNFFVTLQAHFGTGGENLPERFLTHYCACRKLSHLPGLRLYQAFAYLRRATICARSRLEPAWRQQTQTLLARSRAALQA